MKYAILALIFTATSAFAAGNGDNPTLSNGNIRCETVVGGKADLTVQIGKASGRNVPYEISQGDKILAKGTAIHDAFTSGESLSDASVGFTLSVSPLAEHPDFFPNRWAKFWAKLELVDLNVVYVDLACAKL